MVADGALSPEWVRETVPDLLTDPARLAAMSKAATLVIPRDADDKLAEMILGAPSAAGSRR
jgi:UDP-N-acetylglucosamine--N-acetylmuramyl-(pentapeptide) pyrophosphoryl-undecaprenol N-acetylglucosamine transferase